jgi:WD40 repeat protein
MGLSLSPDGKFLAVSGKFKNIRVYDVSSADLPGRVLQGHSDQTLWLAFSPDGKRLASTSVDRTLRIWNMDSGQSLVVIQWPRTVKRNLFGQVFSPNGKWVVASGDDNNTYVWDADSGNLLKTLAGNRPAFTPDGKRLVLVTSDELSIEVLDVADWQALFMLKGHTKSNHEGAWGVAAAAFSPDGMLLASVGYDDKTLRLWDMTTGQAIFTLQKSTSADTVAFSPDGMVLATHEVSDSSPDSGIYFWGVK